MTATQFSEKWYDLATWKHYLIWFIITFTVTLIPFHMIKGSAGMQREILCAGALAIIMAIVPTGMVTLSKMSSRFYEKLSAIQTKVNDAKTADQLLDVRKELIQFHRKNSAHKNQGQAVKEILILIETRLKYQFSYEFPK